MGPNVPGGRSCLSQPRTLGKSHLMRAHFAFCGTLSSTNCEVSLVTSASQLASTTGLPRKNILPTPLSPRNRCGLMFVGSPRTQNAAWNVGESQPSGSAGAREAEKSGQCEVVAPHDHH